MSTLHPHGLDKRQLRAMALSHDNLDDMEFLETLPPGALVLDLGARSGSFSTPRADLQITLPVIEAFGRVEGLDAHARSARIRFEKA